MNIGKVDLNILYIGQLHGGQNLEYRVPQKMETKTGEDIMVLEMSLHYWLYLKNLRTDFFHITHI